MKICTAGARGANSISLRRVWAEGTSICQRSNADGRRGRWDRSVWGVVRVRKPTGRGNLSLFRGRFCGWQFGIVQLRACSELSYSPRNAGLPVAGRPSGYFPAAITCLNLVYRNGFVVDVGRAPYRSIIDNIVAPYRGPETLSGASASSKAFMSTELR